MAQECVEGKPSVRDERRRGGRDGPRPGGVVPRWGSLRLRGTVASDPVGSSPWPKLDRDPIAARAYALYVRGGRRPGRALEDWLEAERQAEGGAAAPRVAARGRRARREDPRPRRAAPDREGRAGRPAALRARGPGRTRRGREGDGPEAAPAPAAVQATPTPAPAPKRRARRAEGRARDAEGGGEWERERERRRQVRQVEQTQATLTRGPSAAVASGTVVTRRSSRDARHETVVTDGARRRPEGLARNGPRVPRRTIRADAVPPLRRRRSPSTPGRGRGSCGRCRPSWRGRRRSRGGARASTRWPCSRPRPAASACPGAGSGRR